MFKSMFVKNIKVCDKHGFLLAENMCVIKKQNLKQVLKMKKVFEIALIMYSQTLACLLKSNHQK